MKIVLDESNSYSSRKLIRWLLLSDTDLLVCELNWFLGFKKVSVFTSDSLILLLLLKKFQQVLTQTRSSHSWLMRMSNQILLWKWLPIWKLVLEPWWLNCVSIWPRRLLKSKHLGDQLGTTLLKPRCQQRIDRRGEIPSKSKKYLTIFFRCVIHTPIDKWQKKL